MTGKTMLFETILTAASIVGLYESWNYLNSASVDNYSQTGLLGFIFLMITGTMFAIGFMYLLDDLSGFFSGKRKLKLYGRKLNASKFIPKQF